MLVPTTAETLYRYDDKFYKGFSAITKNSYGKGFVYYLGTTPDDETLKKVLEGVIDSVGIEKITSPQGVEVVTRGQGENKVQMIINHNDYDVQFETDTLKPFEVKIVKK
jgi:beta-galactosidase